MDTTNISYELHFIYDGPTNNLRTPPITIGTFADPSTMEDVISTIVETLRPLYEANIDGIFKGYDLTVNTVSYEVVLDA